MICSLFTRLLYPPICLHCDEYIEKGGGSLICPFCSYFFDFLDVEGSSPAACFEYYGGVATFVKALKSKSIPYLFNTAAALLLMQYTHLNWSKPDLIIPVPCRSFFYHNDHVHLMARSLAKLMNTKSTQAVRRVGRRPRQTQLSQEERMTLLPSHFRVREPNSIQGKCILLIDDVMTTRSTLLAVTTLLKQQGAQEVYALTVAEALLAPVTCTSP